MVTILKPSLRNRPDTVATPDTVPKLIGYDFELSQSVLRRGDDSGHASQAARLLLNQIPGYPTSPQLRGTLIEYGRRFLSSTGGSAYIDSDHLELNLPEVRTAFGFAVLLHGAGFRLAQQAKQAASARLPEGCRLNVVANCSDGNTAWGGHLNILMTRRSFLDVLYRKPHQAGFLATHFVTSLPYTGQGLVGPANDRPHCDFQLGQRPDWFEEFSGQETMHHRPLLNQRDESHATNGLARMHIIYFDLVLSPIANVLKAGTTQLVLAMIEKGWTDPTLQLDDPVAAASAVSRDLRLKRRLPTVVRGRRMTAIEVQQGLADLAGEFVASGAAMEVMPDAEKIVGLWQSTLDLLRRRDIEALARRCDAWLKYLLIDRYRARNGLSWESVELKVLDSLFASLDPERSLFFQMAADGQVDAMPTEQEIQRFSDDPPEDTRAYFRAHVLRRFGDAVSSMNWDRIEFRLPSGQHWWSTARLPMPDPLSLGRADSEPILQNSQSLKELVNAANAFVADSSNHKLAKTGTEM